MALALLSLFTGCTTRRTPGDRSFNFAADTFAYANELDATYSYDKQGHWCAEETDPPATYARYCFVITRSARQFFQHAQFDPTSPRVTRTEYRRLVRQVIATGPREDLPESDKIIIPGYANLREFSRDHEAMLKEECGSFWQSYFQRGHWRMIFPFFGPQRERIAESFVTAINENRPPIVHLASFPSLSINHAVVLFSAEETIDEIRFATYDPNSPARPTQLVYNRQERIFEFPMNSNFRGGKVQAYEVYRRGSCF